MSDHQLIHSVLALSLGLSRALMPFVSLQSQQFGPGWLPFAAHLVHYGSAIMGTVLGPKMATFRWATRRPLFLATLSKTFGLSLLLLATLPPLIAQFPPFSAILLPFALLSIGVADGVVQQSLLQWAIRNTEPNAPQHHNLLMFLLQLSIGPILATFAIQEGSDVVSLEENLCSGPLCRLPIRLSVPVENLLVLFVLLQMILLLSLWSTSVENWRRTSDDEEEDSPLGQLHKHLIKKHGTTSTVCHYRLVLPLCVLGACSAALAQNFPFAVFNNSMDNIGDQRTQLLTFMVCVLLARLFLTMSNPPSCFSSPNVLLPASLFGAGLAFCTLSVPMLRVYAAGVAGAALGLCAPAIFLQLCDLREKHEKWPNSCTLILCSVELGTCIFPLLFTEVLSAYGSASQLFSSLALLLILVMTVAFVALLNAEAEQKTATKRGDFWGFWRGGRTRRSIRRFVRNVRTSLRPNRDVHGGRRRLRAPTATTVTTQSALLEESISGYCVTRSNYQSVQGLNQCHLLLHIPARRPRTNTAGQIMEEAEERRASSRGSATSSAGGDGTSLRRKHSLPAIVLDAGTPKMSISGGGDQ